MDRLTFEGNFCEIAQCGHVKCPYDTDCSQKQVWERLKQYEDTGLSPIACEESAKIEKGLSEGGYSTSRMVELMCADQEGRVVVMPCKVGNTAYYLNGKFIIDFEVIGYMVDERGAWSFMGEHYEEKTGKAYYCDPDTEKIGKTVFLTREEAEKALAELEGKA